MKMVLKKPSEVRAAHVSVLRSWLDELQAMSDAGDRRPEVYNTFVAVTTEIERRRLRTREKPLLQFPRSLLYTMKAQELARRLAEAEQVIVQTEIERATVEAMRAEQERRRRLDKANYQRRKAIRQEAGDNDLHIGGGVP